jgi:hypothetical protein
MSLANLILKATAKWMKQRTAEIRDRRAALRRNEALRPRYRPLTLKDAAASVMEQAYLKASANGTLPANARQIYYAARGPVLQATGRESLDSNYFTQSLLIDYVENHPGRTSGWNIVFDDRGHFVEPHTRHAFGLGTLSVRAYVRSIAAPEVKEANLASASVGTRGPEGRYNGVLFVEKEGFMPLMEAAKIGERFDLAVTSSKGMSVTAARELVDHVCGKLGLPLYLLHDFDIAGFSIAKTLTASSRRYWFRHSIKAIVDLGLRLADVEAEGLESEPVVQDKDPGAVRRRLAINGATEAEIAFLLNRERVELNAMASDQLVAFIVRKLIAAGARKAVPAAKTLAAAYSAFRREQKVVEVIEAALNQLKAEPKIETPPDIEARMKQYLTEHPAQAWDDAIRQIAEDEEAR